jgi:hypothetical protein
MWNPVAHRRWCAAGPQVRRFGHVGVSINDCITAHGVPLYKFQAASGKIFSAPAPLILGYSQEALKEKQPPLPHSRGGQFPLCSFGLFS